MFAVMRPVGSIQHCFHRNLIASTPLVFMAPREPDQDPIILVVDDEVILRLHAIGVLEDEGFTVIEAASADDALTVLENRSDVRLVFTDIQMPGAMDGMDLARLVHERWPHIMLILTSGRAKPRQDDIPDEGRFVGKPYKDYELLEQIKDLVPRT